MPFLSRIGAINRISSSSKPAFKRLETTCPPPTTKMFLLLSFLAFSKFFQLVQHKTHITAMFNW
jgi:hypothetical protein